MVVRIKLCAYKGCEYLKSDTSYCHAHQKQKQRHGGMRPIKERIFTCRVPECESKHMALGFCHNHYMQYSAGLVVDSEEQRACAYEGCKLKHYAKDLCKTHYDAIRAFYRTEALKNFVVEGEAYK